MQRPEEQAKFPPGVAFTTARIGKRLVPVLCFPKGAPYLDFSWRLNRRLAARESGYAKNKQRQAYIDAQDYYHTRRDLQTLWAIQKGRCYYSGRILGTTFETATYHIDHIEPLTSGGHNGPLNLALVTPLMNQRKCGLRRPSFLRRLKRSARQRKFMAVVDAARKIHFSGICRLKKLRHGLHMRKKRQSE